MAKAHCMAVARDPTTGASLLSATVNVYSPGTVTPISATIFDKSNNVLSNPLTSDATTGLIDFYLSVAQEVDLVVAKAGYTTRTYSNVPVIDDASFDLTALLTTTGDIAYASSANTPARLAVGGTGTLLNVSGGVPRWGNTLDAGGLTITAGGLTVTAGNVGLGGAAATNAGLWIQSANTITGATTSYGVLSQPTFQSSVTAEADALAGQVTTQAAAFTMTSAVGLRAMNPVKGAGSTITSAYGVFVDAQTSGNTNNYGVYINTPSGGATDNVSLLATGGALFAGTVPTKVGYLGLGADFQTGNGSNATLGPVKGSANGPTATAMVGWIHISVNGSTAWLPYWQ